MLARQLSLKIFDYMQMKSDGKKTSFTQVPIYIDRTILPHWLTPDKLQPWQLQLSNM